MNTSTEFRKSNRFEHITTILLEDESGVYLTYGQMINYSADGMCFKSDVAFKPATKINVKLDKPIFKAAPKAYQGLVRWCKEIADDDSQYFYRVGLKY